MIYTCSHPNCQFEQLISSKNKKIYYFEDNKNIDSYCIFHAPLSIKKNFRVFQKELYNEILEDYIFESILKEKDIDFSNVVFLDYDFKDKNFIGLNIDLTNAIFQNNVRFDNLKCKKLILKDTKFLDGGGIKNRQEDKNLLIEELQFRPYALESDFVIDIGSYINDKGLVELNKQGVIKKIRFENHKVGAGKIFFIGLNEYIEEANFRNMLLDNVFFQNCYLKNCYFLNSKINQTEFRNCYFPQITNRILNNEIQGKDHWMILLMFPLILLVGWPLFLSFKYNDFLFYVYLIVFIPYILIFLASLNLWVELSSYLIKKIKFNNHIRSVKRLNNIEFFNTHYCIADERYIYEKLDEFLKIKDKTTLEKQREIIQMSLDSLSSSYSQLKDNFQDKDFQSAGDFFYSQRYSEMLSSHKKSLIDVTIFNIHHFTNGFGESYMKPFLWFVLTIIFFALPLQPNHDYVSTSATPLFLIKDMNISDNNITSNLYINYQTDNLLKNSFQNSLQVHGQHKEKNILYGYDNRYDFNITKQYILKLNEQYFGLSLIKSFSNMIYPFTPEQKKWFQNISKGAVFLSLLESILLWYFAIAFILALWHRIKR
ncbi:hypothetical protein [Sulfurimonas sp. HSL3-2]|uniref:hypothetical protein n=1 Tax=Hydrocurvibacter mobilis TaxID=3131936 RepID=UPI0031F9482D